MDIIIQQRTWSFKSKYDISCEVGNFYAEKKSFSLSNKVKLFDASGTLIASIQGYFSFFKIKQDFIISDKVFHFRTENFWTGVFSCKYKNEKYKLLRHKGSNYSVFEKDNQIACFDKNAISFGKGDVYNAKANSDVNLPLILCLILSVDVTENESSNNDGSFSIDFGNVGPEDRPFDLLWKPTI